MAIEMIDIESSNIARVGYDKHDEVLAVQFKNKSGEEGKTYYYTGVPVGEYTDMLNSESAGAYFASHIRGQFPTSTENPVHAGER